MQYVWKVVSYDSKYGLQSLIANGSYAIGYNQFLTKITPVVADSLIFTFSDLAVAHDWLWRADGEAALLLGIAGGVQERSIILDYGAVKYDYLAAVTTFWAMSLAESTDLDVLYTDVGYIDVGDEVAELDLAPSATVFSEWFMPVCLVDSSGMLRLSDAWTVVDLLQFVSDKFGIECADLACITDQVLADVLYDMIQADMAE